VPAGQFLAGQKYNSPYNTCESAEYVIITDPSLEAPLVMIKFVQALVFCSVDRYEKNKSIIKTDSLFIK
jgi:hypothetical protein